MFRTLQAMPAPLRPLALVVLLVTLTGLASCSKNNESKPTGPPAAKVGTHEIPAQLVNQLVARTNPSPQAVQMLRREMLEKLIDQRLTAEEATVNKLDRTPEVEAQFEAARREVLSRAYLQSIINATPKPSADEMRTYYREHPPLFAERRIFDLQEIIVGAAAPDVMEQVSGRVRAASSLEEIADWLTSRQIKFGRGTANRAAEQIPLELLTRVHALKDGQLAVIPSRQGFSVLKVVSSETAPLSEAAALPRIEQFLVNQRGAAAIKLNLQQLRARSGVSYLGEFARAGPQTPASAAAAPITGTPTGLAKPDEGGK